MRRFLNSLVFVILLAALAMWAEQHWWFPSTPSIVSGDRVLVVSDRKANYSLKQVAAITSISTGDLDAWCKKKHLDKRVYDVDEDTSHESKFWQDAMKHDHDGLPSIEFYHNKWQGPHQFHDVLELKRYLKAG